MADETTEIKKKNRLQVDVPNIDVVTAVAPESAILSEVKEVSFTPEEKAAKEARVAEMHKLFLVRAHKRIFDGVMAEVAIIKNKRYLKDHGIPRPNEEVRTKILVTLQERIKEAYRLLTAAKSDLAESLPKPDSLKILWED